MSSELNPCPFCGGEAKIWTAYRDNYRKEVYAIWCDNEDCLIDCSTLEFTSREKAITAWNQRTECTCKDIKKYPNLFTCSLCGVTQYERIDPNYCPNCGAKVVD